MHGAIVRIARAAMVASVLAVAAAPAPAALAQAELSSSQPASEAVLDAAPQALTLRFSEAVTFDEDAVRVLDRRGDAVTVRPAAGGSGRTLRVELPDDLAEGSYAAGWRVTGAGGAPLAGALNFHVGTTPAQPVASAPPREDRTPSDELRDLARSALIVALATLLVSAAVALLRRRRPAGELARTAAGTALACGVLAAAGLVVIGPDEAGAPPPAPGARDFRLDSGSRAKLNIAPPRVGAPRVTVDVRGAGGQPDFALDAVTARLTHVDRELGPFTVALPKRKVGRFEPDLLTFPFPGRWRVELVFDRGEGDAERVTVDQEIAP